MCTTISTFVRRDSNADKLYQLALLLQTALSIDVMDKVYRNEKCDVKYLNEEFWANSSIGTCNTAAGRAESEGNYDTNPASPTTSVQQ
jgi:hypothetical protein